jgi:hypothetical protein
MKDLKDLKDLKDRLRECLKIRQDLQGLGIDCPPELKTKMNDYIRHATSSSGRLSVENSDRRYVHYQLSTKLDGHTYVRLSHSA